MRLSVFFQRLVASVSGLADEPGLLNRYLEPILWVGLAVFLLDIVAIVSTSGRPRFWRRLRQSAVPITLVYLGLSLSIVSVRSASVFCVIIDSDSLTPDDLELLRATYLMGVFYLTFCWAVGMALIGVAYAARMIRRSADPPGPDVGSGHPQPREAMDQ